MARGRGHRVVGRFGAVGADGFRHSDRVRAQGVRLVQIRGHAALHFFEHRQAETMQNDGGDIQNRHFGGLCATGNAGTPGSENSYRTVRSAGNGAAGHGTRRRQDSNQSAVVERQRNIRRDVAVRTLEAFLFGPEAGNHRLAGFRIAEWRADRR